MNNLAYIDTRVESVARPLSLINEHQDVRKKIKVKALSFLARREHSRLELLRKLSQQFSARELINEVLDELSEQGYQSDDRFTEMYIRTKIRAGYGPFRIKIELREKGVCESTVLSVLDRQMIDWFDLAKQAMQKRFGDLADNLEKEEYIKQRAKQARYLKNKGFYQEHIDCLVSL